MRLLSGDSNSSGILLKNRDDDVTYLRAKNEQGVELFYANVTKLETTSGGIDVAGSGSFTSHIDINSDSGKLRLGNANDLEIYHDGSNSYIQHGTVGNLRYQSGNHDFYNQAGNEFMCRMFQNNSVNLYWDGNLRFHTHEHGIVTTGGSNNVHIYLRTSDGTQRGEVYANNSNQVGFLDETGNWAVSFDRNGTSYNFSHFVPGTNNTHDLGSTSYRWRNVYTNDLHLSNEGHTNSVDGTWGDWTIQEGESDLFLKNNRSGKKYKFNLTEVS